MLDTKTDEATLSCLDALIRATNVTRVAAKLGLNPGTVRALHRRLPVQRGSLAALREALARTDPAPIPLDSAQMSVASAGGE